MHHVSYRIIVFLFCFFCSASLYSGSVPIDKLQYIIKNSTITRVQKPLAVRTDRETLEYFMEHVEELTKHGKDFRKKELILEVKGNGKYGIEMPSKHITGEFELIERQPDRIVYMGYGNASTFFNFSGTIILEVNYTTKRDEIGYYEDVTTRTHIKFDNTFFAILAKAASPILVPKLDKLITKFSQRTKSTLETAYANKTISKNL